MSVVFDSTLQRPGSASHMGGEAQARLCQPCAAAQSYYKPCPAASSEKPLAAAKRSYYAPAPKSLAGPPAPARQALPAHASARSQDGGAGAASLSPAERDARVANHIRLCLHVCRGSFDPCRTSHKLNARLNKLLSPRQLEAFVEAHPEFAYSRNGLKGMRITWASGAAPSPPSASWSAQLESATPRQVDPKRPPPLGPPEPGEAPGSASAVCASNLIACHQDQALDAAIMEAWSSGPGVVWNSPGAGGDSPSRQRHVFMQNKLRDGARIDFYRGAPADDLCNIAWSSWLARLPRYEQLAGAMWSGATERGQEALSHACVTARGNAMEIAVGLAWAAATDGRYLREGHAIEWSASQEEWKEVWKHMKERGLAPGSASAAGS